MEFIDEEMEGDAFGFPLVAAGHGGEMELGDEEGAEEIGFVLAHAAFGKVGDEDPTVVHDEGY